MKLFLIPFLFTTLINCGQDKDKKNVAEDRIRVKEVEIKKNNDDQNINLINKTDFQKTNLRITYEERLNIPKEMIEKMPAEIQSQVKKIINNPIIYFYKYDGNCSNYKIDDSNKYKKSLKSENQKSNSFSLAEFSTYIDYKSDSIVIKSSILNKSYLINKKITVLNWKISPEKKKIGNYLCTKASTIYKNEKITAYFTDDIPFSVGPSIYMGLPGLIVYLEAPDRTYKATIIETLDKIIVEKLKDGEVVSENEYSELVEKYKNTEIIEEKIEEYIEN